MSAPAAEMPGLDRIRARFIDLLDERKMQIAQHALDAWDGENARAINANLDSARAVLHQIAGTAGTVGFAELGITAQKCEAMIIQHLEHPPADPAVCPSEIIWSIDTFVKTCGTLQNA